jgi:hypothetical protein
LTEDRPARAAVAWEAELLRFTAFSPPSVTFEVRPLWEQLAGRAPEEVTERPQEGFRQEVGACGENHLFVIQQPSRLDIIVGVHPARTAALVESRLISMGEYDRAASEHTAIVHRWLASGPALGRIAYGPVLIHKVPDKEEGYRALQNMLPRLPIDDPASSQDFFWQINRPRASTVIQELRVNRLSKWTVIRVQRVNVAVDVGRSDVRRLPELAAVRLEIDLSTEPVRPLPSEDLPRLFDEMRALALEIMERGDVP